MDPPGCPGKGPDHYHHSRLHTMALHHCPCLRQLKNPSSRHSCCLYRRILSVLPDIPDYQNHHSHPYYRCSRHHHHLHQDHYSQDLQYRLHYQSVHHSHCLSRHHRLPQGPPASAMECRCLFPLHSDTQAVLWLYILLIHNLSV